MLETEAEVMAAYRANLDQHDNVGARLTEILARIDAAGQVMSSADGGDLRSATEKLGLLSLERVELRRKLDAVTSPLPQ